MFLIRNTPPILNPLPKFNTSHRKTLISSSNFRPSIQFAIVSRRSFRPKKTMAVPVIGDSGDERIDSAVSVFEQEALIDNGGVSNHQTVGVQHIVLNRLSKWFVSVTYGGVIILRHDSLALWAAMGSVLNILMSVALKHILNQDRPVSEVKTGPGMPSSHAQSISFATIFMILSIVGWLGLNGFSAVLSGFIIAIGVYFSWLRVLLRYHTMSQVVVGAVVGSIFSVLWFWTWNVTILEAYNSYLWVRVLLVVGAAFFCVGFISHVLRYWMKDEQ